MTIQVQYTPQVEQIEVTTLWDVYSEPPLEPTLWEYLANNN